MIQNYEVSMITCADYWNLETGGKPAFIIAASLGAGLLLNTPENNL